jgi:hypothetical protein
MAPAKSRSTGLGMESEGLELPLSELPEWEEGKIKILPMVSLIFVWLCQRPVSHTLNTIAAVEKSTHRRTPLPSAP